MNLFKKITAGFLVATLSLGLMPPVSAQEFEVLDENVLSEEYYIETEGDLYLESDQTIDPEVCIDCAELDLNQQSISTISGSGQYAPPDPTAPRPSSPQPLDPKAFLQSFKGQHNVSLFSGTLSYQYPIWSPAGRNGIQPNLGLGYSGMDTRFTTAVGYGWSLPTNGIYRTPEKGKDQTFTANEFTADIFGDTQELVLVNAATGEYAAKNEGAFTQYVFNNNQWSATDRRGTIYSFGSTIAGRQAHSQNSNQIYKWMLEKVQDANGNYMTFSYVNNGGAIYPKAIRYTGHGSDVGAFEIRFTLKSRPAYLSYSTAFPITHQKLIDEIQIFDVSGVTDKKVMTYKLHHTPQNNAIILLNKITVTVSDGKTLPPTTFDYYPAGPAKQLNRLRKISEPYGATHQFNYQPSTSYRKANQQSEHMIPFVVYTVRDYSLQAGPGEPVYKTTYDYKNGHYYADKRDSFDREYAGFGEVIVSHPSGNTTKYFYHQSENDADNAVHTNEGEYQDHISKKGRLYRQEAWQGTGKKLSTQINKWNFKALPSANQKDRWFTYLEREVKITDEGQSLSNAKSTAVDYRYDAYGNIDLQTDYGQVSVTNNKGDFTDIGTDKVTASTSYINNTSSHLLGFVQSTLVKDQTNKTLLNQRYFYDQLPAGQISKGNVTQVDAFDGLKYLSQKMEYDIRGLLTKTTNPRGYSTSYTYDSANLYPAKVTNALSHMATYEYDKVFGVPIKMTDANQVSAYTELDSFGRKIKEFNERAGTKNLVHQYEYRLTQYPFSMVQKTNPGRLSADNGPVETVIYTYFDGLARPIQTRRNAMAWNEYIVSGMTYDSDGRVKKEFLPQFKTGTAYAAISASEPGSEFIYDALSRPVEIKTPLGSATTTYLPWQNEVIDVMGNKKQFTYDAHQNLIEVKEYLSGTAYSTFYTYDTADNLVQIKNAKGELKKMSYDPLHRRTSMSLWYRASNASPKQLQWTYDDNGNIASSTDARGNVIQYKYDNLDRLISEDYTGQSGIENFYTYDNSTAGTFGIGRVSQIKTPDATKVFTYNEQGLPKTYQVTAKGKTGLTKYDYDWLGNRFEVIHPNNEKVEYMYDPSNRINGLLRWGVNTDIYAYSVFYSPIESISRITTGNSVETQNTYDINQLYRLTNKKSLNHTQSSQVIQNIDYTFDKAGNITRVEDRGSSKAAHTIAYVYDDLYRLTKEIARDANANTVTTNYTYDITGNITSVNSNTYAYSHVHPQAATQAGSKTYTYDDAGNLTAADGWTHTYDYKNRLIKSAKGTTTLEYAYDEGNTRVLKKETNGTQTTTTHYFTSEYETEDDLQRVKVFLKDLKIATVENNPTTNTSNTYWHHPDHLGSASLTTDVSGNLIEESHYLAYGTPLVENQSTNYTNDYKYTGKEKDNQTDLYYYGARYYDPSLKRFTGIDPWEGDLTDPQSLNKYAYVRNNPIKYVDPTGEYWHLAIGAGIGAIIGVGIQGASDIFNRQLSSRGTYGGAAAGGAIQGFAFAVNPTSLALNTGAGIAAGAANSATKSTIDGEQIDSEDIAYQAIAGGATGMIPGPIHAPGTSLTVTKAMNTKLANGAAKKVSAATSLKMMSGNIDGQIGGALTDWSVDYLGSAYNASQLNASYMTGSPDINRTYTVQSGDTLSGVFGSDWQSIAEYNNLSNPNLIRPGQQLNIPSN